MNPVKLSAFLLCSMSFPENSTLGIYVSDGGTFETVKFYPDEAKPGISLSGLFLLVDEFIKKMETDDYRNIQLK